MKYLALVLLFPFLVGFCYLCGENPYPPPPSLSPQSPHNPYATAPPKIYDEQGTYRGEWSANPYRPDSTSNPYGRYGNPLSPESLNNRFYHV